MACFPERLRRVLVVALVLALMVLGAGGAAGAAPPLGAAPAQMAGASQAAGAQPDPQGPAQADQVRDDVRQVMSRPEFDYTPSWLERALEWIAEQLSKLFEPGDPTTGGSTFGGGIGALLGWLLILAAVVALLAIVVWVVLNRPRRARRPEEEPLPPAQLEHRRRAEEWMADAERLEAAGEWKEAIRARYRNLVRVLVDRRQLPDVPGRTTGELRGDLDRTTPAAHDSFDTACLLFELPWYADVPTGPDANARFSAAAERVLAAPVDDRFDPVTLFDVTGVEREVAETRPGEAAAARTERFPETARGGGGGDSGAEGGR